MTDFVPYQWPAVVQDEQQHGISITRNYPGAENLQAAERALWAQVEAAFAAKGEGGGSGTHTSHNAGEESPAVNEAYEPATTPDIVTFTLAAPAIVEVFAAVECQGVEGEEEPSELDGSIFVDGVGAISSFQYGGGEWNRASLEGGAFGVSNVLDHGGTPAAVILGAGVHTVELRYTALHNAGCKIRDRFVVVKL